MAENSKIFDELVQEACDGLIPGSTALRPEVIDHLPDDVELVAVIGFSGDKVRGAVGLSAPPEIIRAIHPSPNSDKLSDDDLEDWTGELANQLLGRLKIGLIERGLTFWMATPVVLRGIVVRIVSKQRGEVHKYRCKTSKGEFWMWLDMHIEEGALHPKSDDQGVHQAGEVILF